MGHRTYHSNKIALNYPPSPNGISNKYVRGASYREFLWNISTVSSINLLSEDWGPFPVIELDTLQLVLWYNLYTSYYPLDSNDHFSMRIYALPSLIDLCFSSNHTTVFTIHPNGWYFITMDHYTMCNMSICLCYLGVYILIYIYGSSDLLTVLIYIIVYPTCGWPGRL
jgi:hypothetical protein